MFDDLRAAWGARNPTREPTHVNPSRRTAFMNHYDGGSPLLMATHADCLARVKQDQAFHMNTRGWSDIGYNGLVCQHGRAIEGRGIDYAGAHCPDHNTTAYGWQFMVGGAQVPTPAAYTRMAKAYGDCLLRSGHGLVKLGHRDGFATECPGTAIQAWVKAGMNAPSTETKDWFDMASIDDLRTIVREELARPEHLQQVARYVLTGYATGPVDSQRVLTGHLTDIKALAAALLTPEQLAEALKNAVQIDVTVSSRD